MKIFTFRYSAALGGFDETPLREFTRDKEILAFREHFFAVNETPTGYDGPCGRTLDSLQRPMYPANPD